jgi:hypothetical protein
VEKVEDVKTGLIKSRRIIFTPSVDLKDELAATSIMITCYDRTGKEVKRVTSTSGEVEDNEDELNSENGTTENGSTDSGSQNSGSQSGSGSQNSGSDQGGSGDNTGGSGDEPGGSDH